jgi:hypothetical protein
MVHNTFHSFSLFIAQISNLPYLTFSQFSLILLREIKFYANNNHTTQHIRRQNHYAAYLIRKFTRIVNLCACQYFAVAQKIAFSIFQLRAAAPCDGRVGWGEGGLGVSGGGNGGGHPGDGLQGEISRRRHLHRKGEVHF